MNDVSIVTAQRALPAFSRTTDEILPYLDQWLRDEPDRLRRKARKIFEGAGVDRRYGIMDVAEVFTPSSFEAKNRLYAAGARELGNRALQAALEAAGWEPDSLDILITVSCTGIMIPSLDAYLIDDQGLRGDIIRLPVTEMGCVGGVSGLIYARRFLQAGSASRAAVLAVESPAATFQHNDRSMANIISAAIFGDGASCVLLSNEAGQAGPRILAEGMYHFPESTGLMGFDLTNRGLRMILDPDVPHAIGRNFQQFLGPFLARSGLEITDLRHLIFHPGGRKIVETVSELFRDQLANMDKTREVLRHYGNMSSATVLYVLQAYLEDPSLPPGPALILSFGPGFTAQRMLIEFSQLD